MFPFKTKSFSFTVNDSIEVVRKRLSNSIKERRMFRHYYDDDWIGSIKNNNYIVEQVQFWKRNSFRPIICFSIQPIENNTLIKGYYRIDFLLLLFPSIITTMGIWIAIKNDSIFPLLFLSCISAFFLSITYLLFLHSYKKSKKEFEKLFVEKHYY